MPDIGVGFKLFADATALERGIVRARKEVRALDDETKVFKKTFGTIGSAIAASGVVQAFSSAISSAQALRDEAKKNGSAIAASTDALARYGDTLDSIKSSVADFGRSVLGGFNLLGEAIGEAVGNGVSLGEAFKRNNVLRESEVKLANTLRTIDEARVKYNKSLDESLEQQAKSRDRILKLTKEAGDLERKNWMENLSSAQKMRFFEKLRETSQALLKDPNASEEQTAGARIALQQAQEQINKLTLERIDSDNEVKELRRQEKREKRDLTKDRAQAVDQVAADRNALTDRSKLTLAELAAVSPFSAGVDSKLGDAGRRAREASDLEQKAEERRKAGDFTGSEELRNTAGGIRESLVKEGVLKSSEGDPSVPLKKALKASEEALQSIDKKLAGVAD